jgi:hypothetical protein
MGRLYMKGAATRLRPLLTITVGLQLSDAGALVFVWPGLLARTGIEAIEGFWAHYRNQLDVLRGYTDDSSTSPSRSEVCGRVQNAGVVAACLLSRIMQNPHMPSLGRYGEQFLQSSSRGETMRVLNDWPIMP